MRQKWYELFDVSANYQQPVQAWVVKNNLARYLAPFRENLNFRNSEIVFQAIIIIIQIKCEREINRTEHFVMLQ